VAAGAFGGFEGGAVSAPNPLDVFGRALPVDASIDDWKAALRGLSAALGWHQGSERTFQRLVSSADSVLVKPNWVRHANRGPWGIAPLITSPELVKAVCEVVLENSPRSLILGDAPVQGCDIESLWRACDFPAWAAGLRARGHPLRGPEDFRRTISRDTGGVMMQTTNVRHDGGYRFINLGRDSLLEPVTSARSDFRVTQYNPDLMTARHHRGHHEYLVAREVLDSSLVFNLPKLKTHKKAGITAALKNLVGINGNKEFLPHHRVGSPKDGGDCYPRANVFKRIQERLYDQQNRASSLLEARLFRLPIRVAGLLSRYHRERIGIEGAWDGNDTVWRMCLDLNRALLYADSEGALHDAPQRREVHIVDAVVCGIGDGPLAPEPFPLGLVLASAEAPAIDQVGALLLGYLPERIALVRESFGTFRFPICTGSASQVRFLHCDGSPFDRLGLLRPDRYPEGWMNAVDRDGRTVPPIGTTYQG
jgi:uncharacterized protein (DUF362 family)